MRALEHKLVRDLVRLKGQVITISFVLAAGIMAMVMMRGTWSSMIAARDTYYSDYRFADLFARIERAPDPVASRLEQLPGVARVATRVVEEILVPLDDDDEPIPGRIVSIPRDEPPPLNALYLRSGRLPEPGVADEAVVLEQFARAHELHPGNRIPAVVGGVIRQLRIVGVALSPEYIFAMSGTEHIADPGRFAVLWMRRDQIAPALQMEGSFNDVVFALEPGASARAVADAVDRELAPYGGFHAVARDRQASNYVLQSELDNLSSIAVIVPLVFLGVAVFLVNVVISRLVSLDRTQIAVLKALGYRDTRIALHYLALVALIASIGAALGVALGIWAGRWMTGLYAEIFRFPHHAYGASPGLVGFTLAGTLAAATAGALSAVRRVAKLPPAQAMRPPSPQSYRRSSLERLGLGAWLGPSAMMVVREIARRPLRFLLSVGGIAMGVAIYIFGTFSGDSFDRLMNDRYLREHRGDLAVTFSRPMPGRAVRELASLPGVELAEGERAVAVRLRAGSRWRDAVVFGYAQPSELRRFVRGSIGEVALPDAGVVMTDRLAQLLGVGVGSEIEAEILEGEFSTRPLVVAGLIDEPFGLQAYARADWLAALLREQPRVTSVMLRVDPAHMSALRARIRELPAVVGATRTERIIENFEEQTGKSIGVVTLMMALCAAAISIGVVYNNARIALSMRSRDLASLRVLGFTRKEISAVLLGELGIQVVLGIPLGLLLGRLWADLYVATIDLELMDFPVFIEHSTYGTAALIALASGIASALLVRRKLDQLDLIAVLKAAE